MESNNNMQPKKLLSSLLKSKLPNVQKRIKLQDLKLRTAQIFQDRTVIGEGTFGKVYKAQIKGENKDNIFYALKMIKMDNDKEGFPITAMREIKLLKQLNHPNIVNLVEIVTSSGESGRGQVYLVFEYAEHDLQGVLEKGVELEKSHFKCLIKQLIEGIAYLHKQGIMHRDIKGGNLLLTKDGVLKIADFGLAREFIKVNSLNFTVKVVTRWYRAPELLLNNSRYGASIDVWSIGCFIVEMFLGKPIFPGRSDLEQLPVIFEKLGVPDQNSWPGVCQMKGFNEAVLEFKQKKQSNPSYGSQNLRQYLMDIIENGDKQKGLAKHLDESAIDLIMETLDYDPKKRITAEAALKHPYFTQEPLPCQPEDIPQIEGELKELNFRDARNQKINIAVKQQQNQQRMGPNQNRGTPPRMHQQSMLQKRPAQNNVDNIQENQKRQRLDNN